MATMLRPRPLKARMSAQSRMAEAADDLYVVGLLLAFGLLAILLSFIVLQGSGLLSAASAF